MKKKKGKAGCSCKGKGTCKHCKAAKKKGGEKAAPKGKSPIKEAFMGAY
jgi:Na+-transporting NADH:ubiquinone oxidoreductase subunit NqrF